MLEMVQYIIMLDLSKRVILDLNILSSDDILTVTIWSPGLIFYKS